MRTLTAWVLFSAVLFLASCDTDSDSGSASDRREVLRSLASVAFQVTEADLDHPLKGVNYDYNDWRAYPGEGCKGYDGGHSGIDMQTKDVEGEATADRDFHSLTDGEVIAAGNDRFNSIAIYDAKRDRTMLYLHARKVYVAAGDTVKAGDRLGQQGNAGLGHDKATTAEHVHIEVRAGRKLQPACGASTTLDPLLNL